MRYYFETYDNNEQIKKEILENLTYVFDKYECSGIVMPVFTCINELLVNAVKANFKNLYFEKYAPCNNALDVIPYHKALQLFKLEMATNRIDYLVSMAKENGIITGIEICVDNDKTLTITVSNPSAMTEVEEENINKKREFAKKYNNLTEYFCEVESDPNKEGGGLGILFIIMVLKSFGLNEDNLKIFSEKKKTFSILQIPLIRETVINYLNNTGV